MTVSAEEEFTSGSWLVKATVTLVTAEKLAAARTMRAQTHTMAEISTVVGISRATLYRHLALDAEPNGRAA